MKIEIWSDIMCPFCYIGKRRLEAALAQFPDKDKTEIEWKSFQLNPSLRSQPGKDIYTYLAESKGISRNESLRMHAHVTAMAKEAGLEYNFEKAVVANSFDAHRLIQLAKKKGLGDAAEERIFRAYFTEGADVNDHATLARLGAEIGLDAEEVTAMLRTDAYAHEVRKDIKESQKLGIRGVPFFVMNRQYAVSGAQPVEAFLDTLKASFEEWKKHNPGALFKTTEGQTCTPDGECN